MDAPRGLTGPDADKALRDLFRELGPIAAPDELDARILQRIAVTPHVAAIPEKPLLPRWVWGVAAVAALAAMFIPTRGATGSSDWTNWLPTVSLASALNSPWLLMTLGVGVILFGLDTWLDQRRTRAFPR
jgi:hypothetical protein